MKSSVDNKDSDLLDFIYGPLGQARERMYDRSRGRRTRGMRCRFIHSIHFIHLTKMLHLRYSYVHSFVLSNTGGYAAKFLSLLPRNLT